VLSAVPVDAIATTSITPPMIGTTAPNRLGVRAVPRGDQRARGDEDDPLRALHHATAELDARPSARARV